MEGLVLVFEAVLGSRGPTFSWRTWMRLRTTLTQADFELQDDKEQEGNRFLYSLWGSLLQGRLLGFVRYVASSNGGEA